MELELVADNEIDSVDTGDQTNTSLDAASSLEKNPSLWLHLIAKPSAEDLRYEAKCQKEDPLNHIPMTTRAEIWSWYCYDVAYTPQVMYMVSLIYPLYLSIVSTRYACKHNTPYGCDYDNQPISAPASTLVVYIGSWALKPESFATLMIGLSGLFQLVFYLWFSSIADYSNYQSFLFRFCAIFGNLMVISFFFIPDDQWLFIGIYGALLLVPLGLAWIFYNSYLPVLVENHWLIRRLQRKYKENDTLDKSNYHCEHKKLIQTIQDDISQFGFMMGYFSSFLVGILVGIGLFLLEDITTEVTDTYGYVQSDDDDLANEYWMKPVIGGDIWYSNIVNLQSNESFTYINAMQFHYADMEINGTLFGSNNLSHFIFDDSLLNISLMHVSYNFEKVVQINVMQMNGSENLINGIQFISNENETISIGQMMSGDNLVEIKPDKYPIYQLSGYQIDANMYNDTSLGLSLPIIYSYSFAFMDIKSGQFGSTFDNRIIYAFCGIWCILFAIPAFCTLKSRTKPNIPKTSSVCTVSCKDYYKIARHATNYPNLFYCLLGWFIWSDAINTTQTIGVLFGQTILGMNAVLVLVLFLELQFLAVIGTVLFVWLGKKFNLTNKNLLVIHLLINAGLPIWTIFGLFGWGFGMTNVWEMFVFVGLFLGLSLGSLFSSSRSLYGHLIPVGFESQFFGLYQVTDKGSSWIGPLFATFISNILNLRYSLIYVLVFYIISIPIVQFCVNYEEGMIQSGRAVTGDTAALPAQRSHDLPSCEKPIKLSDSYGSLPDSNVDV